MFLIEWVLKFSMPVVSYWRWSWTTALCCDPMFGLWSIFKAMPNFCQNKANKYFFKVMFDCYLLESVAWIPGLQSAYLTDSEWAWPMVTHRSANIVGEYHWGQQWNLGHISTCVRDDHNYHILYTAVNSGFMQDAFFLSLIITSTT